jgi:hypothetical protein
VTHHTHYLCVPVTELLPLIPLLLGADYQRLNGVEDIGLITRLAKNLSSAISTQLSTPNTVPEKTQSLVVTYL